jgi:hypothetical protein
MEPNDRKCALITIVGHQPMPLVLAALHYCPANIELIASKEVEHVAKAVRTTLRHALPKAHSRIMASAHAYDAASVAVYCNQVRQNPRLREHDFLVNISGGTTMMAMGAQQAARDFGWRMCYIDSDHGLVIELNSVGQVTAERQMRATVSVEHYLHAHSATYAAKNPWGTLTAQPTLELERLCEAAELIASCGPRSAPVLDEIRRSIARQEPQPFTIADDSLRQGLVQPLTARGFLVEHGRDHWRVVDGVIEREFLRGHWLEIYIWSACQKSGRFDDVRCSVQIERRVELATKQSYDVVNELDVVITSRGRMAAVACKTGPDLTQAGDDRGLLALYELNSLLQTDLMGLYARKALVTNQAIIDQSIRGRAHMGSVACFSGGRLRDVPELLYKLLDGR